MKLTERMARWLCPGLAARADYLKSQTGCKISFTYEPTGERINLYAPSRREFQIINKHPEILAFAYGPPLDLDGQEAGRAGGDNA